MITYGRFLQDMMSALIKAGADNEEKVLDTTALQYWAMCEQYPWQFLRRTTSISFASPDSNNEMLLPANLAGIESVWDSDGYEYTETTISAVSDTESNDDYRYRWYFGAPVTSGLLTAKEFGINQAASSFTMTTTWDSDWVGEYIRFQDDLSVYLISASKAISEAYRGEALSNGWASIRPEGTKRMGVLDPAGAAAGTTVTVAYWVYPYPIAEPHHIIQIPHHEALKYAVLADMTGPQDRRRKDALDYYALADKHLAIAKDLNPRFVPPRRPRNKLGTHMRWK